MTAATVRLRRARRQLSLRAPSPETWVFGSLGIISFLILWEAAVRAGWVDERFLPAASTVLAQFAVNLGLTSFWVTLGQTVTAALVGFVISVVSATALGIGIGSNRFLQQATYSVVEFLRPIPSVALIPLAVLLFGVKIQSELLLIVYATFWPIFIQVLYGVTDVDKVANDTAKTLGLSRGQKFRYLIWPTILPYFMTGARLASSIAIILAISAELVIGTAGLGNSVALAQSNGATASMYALILAAGALGVLVNIGARLLERKLLFWHASIRGEIRQ